MKEYRTLADVRDTRVINRVSCHPELANKKTNILTLAATNMHLANANGNRSYIEVGVEDGKHKPIQVGYVNMSHGDVYKLVGNTQIEIYKNAEILKKKPSKDVLVSSVINGSVDVGITKGTVPDEIIPEGVMVFSPLYYNREGKTRIPKDPVTIIARVPHGK